MSAFDVSVLRGDLVRLEPLDMGHIDGLMRAALEDRQSYNFTTVPANETQMTIHIEGLLRESELGLVVPFAQVANHSQRVVGMTRFLTLRSLPGAAVPFATEIGGTWLAATAQRTGLNTEAKFLLLRHAFEEWRVARVDFKTDVRNERSRAAIARLGASLEGTLRQWQPSLVPGEEGKFRDTAMFSIVAAEWPHIQTRLGLMMVRE